VKIETKIDYYSEIDLVKVNTNLIAIYNYIGHYCEIYFKTTKHVEHISKRTPDINYKKLRFVTRKHAELMIIMNKFEEIKKEMDEMSLS